MYVTKIEQNNSSDTLKIKYEWLFSRYLDSHNILFIAKPRFT